MRLIMPMMKVEPRAGMDGDEQMYSSFHLCIRLAYEPWKAMIHIYYLGLLQREICCGIVRLVSYELNSMLVVHCLDPRIQPHFIIERQ